MLLKAQGTLEKRLAPLGNPGEMGGIPRRPATPGSAERRQRGLWHDGETPPIFAEPLAPTCNMWPMNRRHAQGRGDCGGQGFAAEIGERPQSKRVALNKNSNVPLPLVKALEKAGLKYEDVQTVFLNPSDARAAFRARQRGRLGDLGPVPAAAEHQLGRAPAGRRRRAGQQSPVLPGLAPLCRAKRQGDQADCGRTFARLDAWARQNFKKKDVAGQLSSQIGLDVNIVRVAAERGTYDVRLLDAKVIAEQQRIADVFHQLKLIKALSVKDIVWSGQ